MRISFIIMTIGLFASASVVACTCGRFSTPEELFKKSDLVFVGSKVLGQSANIESPELFFTIHRFAKGDPSTFGSGKIKIRYQEDVSLLCRGYKDRMSYLVFAVKNKTGSYSFLTDCRRDTISIGGSHFEFKEKKMTDFNFFKVSAINAFKETSPRYASDMTESEAKELATQHLLKSSEFRKIHGSNAETWKAISIKQKEDDRSQLYWRVEFAPTPARPKGDFYFVEFYNSLPRSFQILPGN